MIGKRDEYARMAECEKDLWWYRCLHELTIQKIKAYHSGNNITVLDAGCGTGGLLSILKKNGFVNIEGFDVSEDAIDYAASTEGLKVRKLNLLDVDTAYSKDTFDVIVSNDVLYFLTKQEQKRVISKFISRLKPSGVLLLNLPAGKLFRGTHDIAVGIKDRYSVREVMNLTDGAAIIKEITFWPFLLSPLIFLARLYQRMTMIFIKKSTITSDVSMPHPFVNRFLYRLIQFENSHLSYKPWGSSMFVVIQNNPS